MEAAIEYAYQILSKMPKNPPENIALGLSATATMPGAELLAVRLRRAQEVPAEERCPEVAAFVESDRLLSEIPRLLPMTEDGHPALPPGPDTRRRLAQAAVRLARARYACPLDPPLARHAVFHIAGYRDHWQPGDRIGAAAASSASGGCGPGAELHMVALAFFSAALMTPNTPLFAFAAVASANAVHTLLESCPPEVLADMDRQLAALLLGDASDELASQAASSTLTAAQLCYECCRKAVSLENLLHEGAGVGAGSDAALDEGRLPPDVAADAAACCAKLADLAVELDPENPDAWLMRGYHMEHCMGRPGGSLHSSRRALECCIHGTGLARVQGAACSQAMLASMAVQVGTKCWLQLDLGTWQGQLKQAEEDCRDALRALKPCRALLPEPWVCRAEADVDRALKLLACSEEHLRRQQMLVVARQLVSAGEPAGGGAGGTSRAEPSSRLSALLRETNAGLDKLQSMSGTCYLSDLLTVMGRSQTWVRTADTVCDGCGEKAVGLRRCARCRTAQYCSKDCQVKHWREHKSVCCAAAAVSEPNAA